MFLKHKGKVMFVMAIELEGYDHLAILDCVQSSALEVSVKKYSTEIVREDFLFWLSGF